MFLERPTRQLLILLIAIAGCVSKPESSRADDSACFQAPSQDCLFRVASEAVAGIQDKATRAYFLADLGFQLAMSGMTAKADVQFTKAISASGEIDSTEARFAALAHIADRQEDAGQLDDAKRTLALAGELVAAQIATAEGSAIETWRHRQDDLKIEQARIETKHATVERERQSSADAARTEDAFERLVLRTATAARQIEAGDGIGAAETLAAATLDAALLTDPEQQLSAWLEVGRLHHALGRCDMAATDARNALAALGQLQDGANLSSWTAALALFLLELGEG
jgi:hypothetical protein